MIYHDGFFGFFKFSVKRKVKMSKLLVQRYVKISKA